MSTITLPTGFIPDLFSLRLGVVQRSHASPFGGSEQVVDLLNDRWLISMTLPLRSIAEGAAIEAFVAAMRGMTNTVNLWHRVRQAPRGTMRGSPTTTSNPAAIGAASINIATTAGATLLAGDLIGISGLLLQVASDCTADGSGAITVPLVNRLRAAISTGTAVIWDKPSIPCRLMSTPSVQYVPGYAEGVALDFAEVIS